MHAVPSKINAPLSLTHVSRHWRAIAHSTPALWSWLQVNNVNRVRSPSLISEWLDRSQDVSLRISLRWSSGSKALWQLDSRNTEPDAAVPTASLKEIERAIAVVATVVRHGDCLETLCISLHDRCLWSPVWATVKNKLRRLKFFESP
jgi:hypothetical protein